MRAAIITPHTRRMRRARGAIANTPGGVAEWLKAPVLKTGVGVFLYRGFESHPHRF